MDAPKDMLRRSATITRASIDEDARTAEFSFSSEAPVERGFGFEVLDHRPESVRLGRLSDGGPVLVGHDVDDQVGVVESVSLDGGKGRVLARFSRSARGEEIWRDVVDGIRRNVSVGYRVLKMIAEDTKEGARKTFRAVDWEPYEVSFVPVAADPGVGMGRQHEESKMDNETDIEDNTEITDEATMPDIDIREIEGEATKRERQRVNEITAIAGKFPHSKRVQVAAKQAVHKGENWQDFGKRAIDLIASEPMPTEIGMEKKEVQRYSLLRMLNAQTEAALHGRALEKTAPFEYACHMEILDRLPAKRADQVRGMLVPWDVQVGGQWRAAPADTTENASLVAEDHLAGSFIEGLRATSVVMQAGATTLNGLVGDVSIPREESIPVEWLTEDEDASDVDYVTDAVTLSPTTVAGAVPITRRLVKQSSPDVDLIVRNNLTRGVAEAIDNQAINGDGNLGLPTGIRNQANVLTQLVVTGALTWAQAVAFETTVEASSNLQAGASYIMHPTMKGISKTTSKDAGSGQFIWDGAMVNGYPAYSSTHAGATGDAIVFGNFSNLLLGFWGVLDVMSDPYTKAASGGLVVRVFQDVDVAVRRGNAFCIETLI